MIHDDAWNDTGLDKAELAALGERSDLRGLLQTGLHGGLLVANTGLVLGLPGLPWLVSVPVQAVLLASLFAPLHESVHFTVFRTRRLNSMLTWPCALALGFVPTGYRLLHYAHHRHSNEWNDPELKGRAVPWPTSVEDYANRMLSPALFGLAMKLPMIVQLARGPSDVQWQTRPYIGKNRRPVIVAEARLCLVLYALLAAGCVTYWPLALATVVPAVLGQVVLAAYLFPEHTGCSDQGSMFERTRTIHTNAVVRFLFWNMPYHTEHHVHPAVPFFALPRLHRALKHRLQHEAKGGYVAFHLQALRRAANAADR